MKITKRALYEEIDEQLQHLIANFHISQERIFQKSQSFIYFSPFLVKFLNIIIFHVHNISKLKCRELYCRQAQLSVNQQREKNHCSNVPHFFIK